MEFRQTQQPASRPATPASHEAGARKGADFKWFKILNFVVLVGVAVLLVAVALAVSRSGSTNEYKYVNSKDYQAVFLNNGQVYFGNVSSINSQYVKLSNIYYLTQNTTTDKNGQTVTDGNYSLVKLGCQQIHDPLDQMVINRDQVTFWENLNEKGKVVQSIEQFKKQNPNGPDCSQVSNQTQASSNGTTQATGNSSNSTTNTTNK